MFVSMCDFTANEFSGLFKSSSFSSSSFVERFLEVTSNVGQATDTTENAIAVEVADDKDSDRTGTPVRSTQNSKRKLHQRLWRVRLFPSRLRNWSKKKTMELRAPVFLTRSFWRK